MFLYSTMFWIIYITYAIIFGIATSYIAGQKGRDKGIWFLVGTILGIIGLLIIGFSKEQPYDDSIIQNKVQDNKTKDEIIANRTFNLTTDFNSPIDILWNSIIKKNNKVFLYSNFKNISSKKVVSISFEVHCFNSFNQYVNDEQNSIIERIIQDLNVRPQECLDENVYIDLDGYPSTRKVNLVIKNVLFEDNSVWTANEKQLLNNEINIITNERALEDIRQIYGEDIISFSELKDDRWICVCGRNNIDDTKCIRCGRKKSDVINNFSIENKDEIIKQNRLEIENERKMSLERQAAEKKRNDENRAKINKRFIIGGIIIIVLSSTFYYVQVLLPKQRIVTAVELLEEERYSESLELYERIINKIDIEKDIRTNLIKIAYGYALDEDYKNSIKVISLLESKDLKYKPTYNLIIKQYEEGSSEVFRKLIFELNNGNFESGEITLDTTLIVGIDLDNSTLHSPFKKYRQKVDAKILLNYSEGEITGKPKYIFEGHEFGGTAMGWGKSTYMYIGEIVENTLEGSGRLYEKQSLFRKVNDEIDFYAEDIYVILYEGEFKQGKYDGKGTIYWGTSDEYGAGIKIQVPEDRIINDRQKLLVGTFKDGNVHGAYTRYYSDGDLNDTGKSYDGISNSNKYGKTNDSNMWSDISIPDDVELVE